MEYSRKRLHFFIATALLLALSLALCVPAGGAGTDAEDPVDLEEESFAEFIIEKIEANYTWLIPVGIAAVLAVAAGILICALYEKRRGLNPGAKS